MKRHEYAQGLAVRVVVVPYCMGYPLNRTLSTRKLPEQRRNLQLARANRAAGNQAMAPAVT